MTSYQRGYNLDIMTRFLRIIILLMTGFVFFAQTHLYAQSSDLPDFLFEENQTQTQQSNASALPDFLETVPTVNASDLGVAAEDEQTDESLEAEARSQAFDAALQGLLPLKPEEIRKLLEHFDRTQEAVELPVYPSPKPEMAVETISLDPGARPAIIRTSYGHVTTLSILDISGQPWPIQDISWAGNFEILNGTEEGAHIIRISPQSEFARGNISMRLLKLQTPVILSIETSRDKVHYRFDAVIAERGPKGTVPIIDQGLRLQAGRANLSRILEGVPSGDAVRLAVDGVDGRTTAYKVNNRIFVRTPLTLLSPGWSSSVSSADGMRVYEIPDTPVILVSQAGKMVRVRLSETADEISDILEAN